MAAAAFPGGAGAAGEERRLAVPYRSQLDGDPYQGGNCGPATMGMILAAFGKQVPTTELRGLVNDMQGTWGDYDSGTLIENLAAIGDHYGLRPVDLFTGAKDKKGKDVFRRWTLDDLRRQLDAGRPVVPQVWFPALPGREKAAYRGDHYLALTGYEGDEFVYNDSIDRDGPGANRRISAAQLEKAWRNSDFPYAAVAFAGPPERAAVPWVARALPTSTPAPAPKGGLRPVTAQVAPLSPTAVASPTVVPSPTAPPATVPAATATVASTATAAPLVVATPREMAPLAALSIPPLPSATAAPPPGGDGAATEAWGGSSVPSTIAAASLLLAVLGLGAVAYPWMRSPGR